MKIARVISFLFLIGLILSLPLPCFGKPFSVPERKADSPYCCDYTGILGNEAESISNEYEIFLAQLNLEFVAVIIPSLNEESIENAAVKIFEEWRIGEEKQKRGILLLISLKEKTVKFEIAYPLEHIYTDAFCIYIADNYIRPFLNQKRIASTLQGTIMAINCRMNLLMDDEGESILTGWENMEFRSNYYYASGGAGAKRKLESGQEISEEILSYKAKELFMAGQTPQDTLESFEKALEYIIKDPHLNIYTEAMRVQRSDMGYWDFFSNAKYLASLRNGKPFKIETCGRFAVAKPNKSYKRGWPLFLVKGVDDRWRLDEARLIQNSYLNAQGNLVISSRGKSGYPYMFAYNGSMEENEKQQKKAWEEEQRNIKADIKKLEEEIKNAPHNYKNYWDLSEIYFRCDAINAAYEFQEKALSLKTNDFRLYEKAAEDCLDYKFKYKKALAYSQKAYDLNPDSLNALRNLTALYAYFKDGIKAEKYAKKLLSKCWLFILDYNVAFSLAVANHYRGNKVMAEIWIRIASLLGMSKERMEYYRRITKCPLKPGFFRRLIRRLTKRR